MGCAAYLDGITGGSGNDLEKGNAKKIYTVVNFVLN
jgi:hypothetical protein